MTDIAILLQNVLNGLLIGGVYALIGIGLTLVFGVMRTINFAHGDFVVLGMYSAILFNLLFGFDPYLSLFIALPLGFVDIKVCAVDATWSGLKLMLRKDLR